MPLVVDAVKIHIAAAKKHHSSSILKIYEEGLATGVASFETITPDWETWNQKFLNVCRFVAIIDKEIVGWAALSSVSNRFVYKGVAENTIYISNKFKNKGVGKILLKYLITESENLGFWTLQASIFTENKPSIRLHEKCGFRIVGRREKIAQRDGVWYDNIFMERRSYIGLLKN